MTKSSKGTRWLLALAVANAALLVGLAVAVWWLRMGSAEFGETTYLSPAPSPSDVETTTMEIPLPLPPSRRKILPRPPGEELIIDLDGEGKIHLAGEPVELGVLRMRLCQLNGDYRRRVVVTIRAADDCLFRHVKDVMNVCEECVISSYRVSSPPAPANLGHPGLNDTSAV